MLDRKLVLELVRVTEAAAVAAYALVGKGDEKAADQAAVDAMRKAFNEMEMKGTVVIGEGERDEAPMLYIGEEVGKGTGPEIDIAIDPLEGTTLTAKAMPNALAVAAISEHGKMLNAPDVYMDKIAVGGGYPAGVVDLDKPIADNLSALAKAKGVPVEEITVCILDRTRHERLIADVRAAGSKVVLITDGDVAGIINCTDEATGIDLYVGSGGAPEGVLAAAALRSIGGQMQGRLLFRNDDERKRAERAGITDFDRKYELEDLASGDVIFCATGVTDGSMLSGVKRKNGGCETNTVVMRSTTGTVRWIKTLHLK